MEANQWKKSLKYLGVYAHRCVLLLILAGSSAELISYSKAGQNNDRGALVDRQAIWGGFPE